MRLAFLTNLLWFIESILGKMLCLYTSSKTNKQLEDVTNPDQRNDLVLKFDK